jgi:broad specificity phosphatase PhoE
VGVILLVRHGQASFGSDNYDVLSRLGERQARRLGQALGDHGIQPGLVVSGSLERQRNTAGLMAAVAGWPPPAAPDSAWNEYDLDRMARAGDDGEVPRDSGAYQVALEIAMRRWADGAEVPQAESFAAFAARTESALAAVAAAQPRGATTVVATSGGVIGWLAASLLGGDAELWIKLNRVCVNTGVTKLVTGRRGISLISFNDHSHLDDAEVSYR